jgi:hypothetical protein
MARHRSSIARRSPHRTQVLLHAGSLQIHVQLSLSSSLRQAGKTLPSMASYLELFGPLAAGSEKALLHHHLKLARDALVYKVEGLSEQDRRRPMTGTGTNLIGVVKHMTWIESWYLCDAFGRTRPELPWERDVDARYFHWSDMYAKPEETTDELLSAYSSATEAADGSIESLALDAPGMHPAGVVMSLRSLLLVVLLDTTRHAGHSDIVREMIDGTTGGREPLGDGRMADDEYRLTYLARVRGEIDTATWSEFVRLRHEPGPGMQKGPPEDGP